MNEYVGPEHEQCVIDLWEMRRMMNAARDQRDQYREALDALRAARMRTEASRRDWAAEAERLFCFTAANKSLDWLLAFGEDHVDLPRVCACITNEQAANLGPGFTRPVCAVHPEVD